MTCAAFRDVVSAYVDGDLPIVEMDAIRAHVSTCSECRVLTEETTAIRDLVRQRKFFVAMPAGLYQRVQSNLDRWTSTRRRLRTGLFATVGLAAVAALAVVSINQFAQPTPIVIEQTGPAFLVRPYYFAETTNTNKAYEIVRSRMNVEVSPVSLSLAQGRLSSLAMFSSPNVARLSYRMPAGIVNFYIAKSPFQVPDGRKTTIMGREMVFSNEQTGLTAAWAGNGVYYCIKTDFLAKEPKGLITMFLSANPR